MSKCSKIKIKKWNYFNNTCGYSNDNGFCIPIIPDNAYIYTESTPPYTPGYFPNPDATIPNKPKNYPTPPSILDNGVSYFIGCKYGYHLKDSSIVECNNGVFNPPKCYPNIECPVAYDNICNGEGVCNVIGKCDCNVGYHGDSCENVIPVLPSRLESGRALSSIGIDKSANTQSINTKSYSDPKTLSDYQCSTTNSDDCKIEYNNAVKNNTLKQFCHRCENEGGGITFKK